MSTTAPTPQYIEGTPKRRGFFRRRNSKDRQPNLPSDAAMNADGGNLASTKSKHKTSKSKTAEMASIATLEAVKNILQFKS